VAETNVRERLAARKAQRQLLEASRSVGQVLPEYNPAAPVRDRLAARKARKAIFSSRLAQSSQPGPQEVAPGILGALGQDVGESAALAGQVGQTLAGVARGAVAHVPETVANIGRSLGIVPEGTDTRLDWMGRRIAGETGVPLEGGAERATRPERAGVGIGRTLTGFAAAGATIPIGIGGALAKEVGNRLFPHSVMENTAPLAAVGPEFRNLLMGMVPPADAVPRMAEAYYAAQTPQERDRVLSEFLAVEGPGLIAAIPAGYGMLRHAAARVAGLSAGRPQVAAPEAVRPTPPPMAGPAPEATQAPIPPAQPPTIETPPGMPPEAVTPKPRPRRPQVQAPVILETPSPPAAVVAAPEPSRAPALPPDVAREAGQMTPVDLAPPVEQRIEQDRRIADQDLRYYSDSASTLERRQGDRRHALSGMLPLQDQFPVGTEVDFMVPGLGFVRGKVESIGTDQTGSPIPQVNYNGQTYQAGEMEGIRLAEGEAPAVQPEAPQGRPRTSETTVRTETQTVPNRWAVVDAADLKTSFDAGYPREELQPRSTDRLISQVTITKRAGENLAPELLAESVLAADGAPILTENLEAYTRNHGIESIRETYARHPEAATRYRKMVEERAERYGIKVPAGAKQPVLVRIVPDAALSGPARRRFAEEANAPSASSMSSVEKARQDAGRLDPEMMQMLSRAFSDDGDLTNDSQFIKAFASRVLPQSELGAFVQADGKLSTDGLRRVQNAILEKAYGNTDLLSRAAESLDDNIRNLTKALLQAAPRFAAISHEMKSGVLKPLDLTQNLAVSAETVGNIRERGDTVKTYLDQFTFEARDPIHDTLVQLLGDPTFKIGGTSPSRSPRLLGEVLRNYADLLEALKSPKFGEGIPTMESVLITAINQAKKDNFDTPSLFTDIGEAQNAERPAVPAKRPEDTTVAPPPPGPLPPEAPGPRAEEAAAVGPAGGAEPAAVGAESPRKRRKTRHETAMDAVAKKMGLGKEPEPTQGYVPKQETETLEVAEAAKALPPGWKFKKEWDGYTLTKPGQPFIRAANLENGARRAWEAEGQAPLFEEAEPITPAQRAHEAKMDAVAKAAGVQMGFEGWDDVPAPEGVKRSAKDRGESVQPFIPTARNYVKPAPGTPAAKEIVGINRMIRSLQKAIDIPIRKGRFQKAKAIGIFKVKPEVIRFKESGRHISDLESKLGTISHEIGHLIGKRIFGRGLERPRSLKDPGLQAQRGALAKELFDLAERHYGGDPSVSEGFAEAVRFYISREAELKKEAPLTGAFLDQWLDRNWKPLAETVREVRQHLDANRNAPEAERVMADLSYENEARPGTTLNDWYERIFDRLEPVNFLVKEIQQGKPLHAGDNPYVWLRDMVAWQWKADAIRHDGMRKFGELGKVGPSVLDAFRHIWDNRKAFDAYLVARRAPSYFDKGMVLPQQRKTYVAAKAQLDAKHPEFADAAKRLDELNDGLLEYLRDAGGISQDGIAALKEAEPFYAPLHRLVEGDGGGFYSSTKGRVVNLGSPIKRKKGGTQEIVSPTESIWRNVALVVAFAERNAAADKLMTFVEKHEGYGKYVERLPKAQVPDRVDVLRVLREAGIDEKDPVMADLAAAGMAEQITMFRPAMWEKDPGVVTVWRKGEPVSYKVAPKLKEALMLPQEDLPHALRLLNYPATSLGAGVVLRPIFMVTNIVRDQFAAFVNTKYGYKPGVDVVRGVYEVARKGDKFWDAAQSGAFFSELMSLDRAYLQRNIEHYMKPKWKQFGHYLVSPMQALAMLSLAGERGTRLMETARGLEKEGRTRRGFTAAGFSGREITTDFQRIGSQMHALAHVARFFHSNMQGLDRMTRQAHGDPVGFAARAAVSITLPSLALYLINKDDPRYDQLDQWKKDTAWPIFAGDRIFWIPKPFEMGILYGSFPERVARKMLEDDPRAFEDFHRTLARQLPSPMPTALIPLMENWANQDWFFDRPVVPRAEEKLEPSEQYGPNTTEIARQVGRLLNISPRKFENVVSGYTGPGGMELLRAASAPLRAATGGSSPPARTLEEILLPGVASRYPSYAGEEVNRFYRDMGEAEQSEATIKRKFKVGDRGEAEQYLEHERSVAGRAAAYREAGKVLAEINAAIQRIGMSNLDGKEKRRQIDALIIKRNELAALVNDRAAQQEAP
jgi:hypothetical protein